MTQSKVPISILIPTYRREQVLIDTINYILALPVTAAEVVVIDQTPQHESVVAEQLHQWHKEQRINWLRLEQPSIPKAMNQGLLAARYDLVLYLDDDIIPDPQLVYTHWQTHQEYQDIQNLIVAGKVIQPWEEGKEITQKVPSPASFATCSRAWPEVFMGGNFSINRQRILKLKGFDENFVGAAFQFEAEFAYRFRQADGKILFEPAACIHHLKVTSGGTRSYGNHLTTWNPNHAVGDYYYLLCTKGLPERFWRMLSRPIHAVITRHHLYKPWWIPATLIAEMRGLLWALRLYWQGPRYINSNW
ncbi:glycosyltransferase family 2 protein [Calothrix membranacea FACHB-236]|nr:glycosyltransferase family 2 protein [Calothrix membranacea FACHB-236]